MGLLTGKKALVLGIANDMSIAWGITKALKAEGAQVALSYLNENLQKRVEPLAAEVGADFIFEMDVTIDEHYERIQKIVEEKWGKFDILVHSLAFGDKNDLKGRFVETSRNGFKMACDISAFSLIGLCNALKNNMNDDASVIAMTYHGSVKVLKGYNVMGVAKAALEASTRYLADDLGPQNIRVNCISAGPIRTLAASAVPGLKDFLKVIEEKAPLRKNVTQDDVGGTAVYLASRLSHGVTGQVLYVDSGINIMAQ
ncbi:SDR family NAD(P)-dependent oxidoreductase [Bacteriovorax stolpii]|uniref:Enoyl-[acyl-carrier-protein] reductase [NADH] n=1 Tax=Bacteriovorax stolpii TaxID=960 RepID=A0A2K9NV70_BACTC|nr:enoyl-[acyl-carrier-protein] reductase FabI [Bacteriovorax stolpii]QDK41356.1 SDR family NAD(P)-dependent oxidoreductase [Bacteriovorax stolpii]TDP55828.1 enoyl-[acyl-carrier-protein] reductase [NADH] [Bacteriovorax stolpii]BDT28800.1 enoyl-ACP reductase [Bacteriovorax sp. HI3]